jgi:hypothetical protein
VTPPVCRVVLEDGRPCPVEPVARIVPRGARTGPWLCPFHLPGFAEEWVVVRFRRSLDQMERARGVER